ncbi:MAG TPA: hypothetical protein VLT58_07820, partial [Polyangia bacterium]|nr:hypothetical protein [Polyangia bacterium]
MTDAEPWTIDQNDLTGNRPLPRTSLPAPWPIAIDPYGCNCTECITGEYVPLERADDAQLAAMLRGEIGDNTNTGELQVVVTVRRTWGDFEREIDPALLG